MPAHAFRKLFRVLTGRIARNVYFWALMLSEAFMLNAGNDRVFHYGITTSDWYLPVMAVSFVLQCSVVYVNNLWLVPRFLAHRRCLKYAGLALTLISLVSILYVVLFKIARTHINVEEILHPAFTTTIISGTWSARVILGEAEMFFIGELSWVFVFTMAWYMNDYARQQQALRQSEHLRIQAELAFLKAQVNPHFLFNTLNNIYGLSLQQFAATPEAILKLSAMLRYLLYESDTDRISFQRERAAIEAYAEIEALRLPDDASISLDISADADYQIPALLWLPMLENAFKHGTRLIHMPVSVDFCFQIREGQLRISTKNYFMDEDSAPGGIGMANLRKRLELLFPKRYNLSEERDRTNNMYTALLTVTLP